MKNYEEMTNSVFTRIENHKIKKKKITKRNISFAALAASVCIVAMVGVFAFGNSPAPKTDDYHHLIDYSYTYTPELAARIKELKSQGDKIGWVYYDKSIYSQLQGVADEYVESLLPGDKIGNADEFTGAYENCPTELNGVVYTVKGHEELLIIKLNNSGTVVLKEE